jgi:hypothetical protein
VYSIIEGSLPPGLAMSEEDGIIAGNPTTLGLYPFRIRVVQSSFTAELSTAIAVVPLHLGVEWSFPRGNVGSVYPGGWWRHFWNLNTGAGVGMDYIDNTAPGLTITLGDETTPTTVTGTPTDVSPPQPMQIIITTISQDWSNGGFDPGFISQDYIGIGSVGPVILPEES